MQTGQPEAALEVLDKAIKYSEVPIPGILELRNEVFAALLQMDNVPRTEV